MTIMRVPKRTSILRSSASDKDRSLGTAKTTRPEMVSVILSLVSPTKSSSGEVSSTLSWDLQDQERRPYSWHFLVCIAFRSQQSTRVGYSPEHMCTGEMHYTPTGLNSYVQLPRDGGVAYAAQESWVLNATIKASIFCWVA